MLIQILLGITLPLNNPVLIFSVILFIILLAPILLHRLKIPDLIGLILAGALIGPNGLHIMDRDSSIILFGTVGLLYIMFMAGLEIDMADFKKNSVRGLTFGLYTFLIPMLMGTAAGVYLLDFSYPTSILLASMFASHTLITYPIVSKYGVTKNRAVNVTIGATIVTCILALLVLAVIVGMSNGVLSHEFWIRLSVSTILFAAVVIFIFPIVGRWFFKRYDDKIGQYIFILGLVFLASFLAEAAGLEAIIGAFLAGLALNNLIPNTSALMNRIEFVGNAFFIPIFLIGVGMLVDFHVFVADWTTVWVAAVMVVVATLAKYVSAWLAYKSFRYTKSEFILMFGLTNAQAAATLAAVLVGYQVIIGTDANGDPIRLLNESVLNGTIVMILVTCIIASFATQKGAQEVALADLAEEEIVDSDDTEDRILIPLSNIENVEELINLGVTVKSKKGKASLTALSIIQSDNADSSAEKRSNLLLEKATKTAAATDNLLTTLLRYDYDVANGIKNAVKEHKITDIVLGLRKEGQISDTFLGNLTDRVLSKCATTTFVYRPSQPFSTLKRCIVVIPFHAEREIGFPYWLVRIWNIGKNTGNKMVFYASSSVLSVLKETHAKHPIDAIFNEFDNWDDFLIISRDIRDNDALMIVMSRKNYPSYAKNMTQVPTYLNKYFFQNNCILVYPMQMGVGEQEVGVFKSIPHAEPFENLEDMGKVLGKLFKKNK
ncbi:cation:proton antiporter [Gabonibacter chumensis]|uniref:cation:proton antiporter n=1 Tax=Gabonibacter chumensis TaxID=2972474 RepID=UPI0025746738|nr:cation:proton antiporter [Gabonibacter chumensis]MCR9011667.1 cation:proton antiporter [Gabonibacter chumensis]